MGRKLGGISGGHPAANFANPGEVRHMSDGIRTRMLSIGKRALPLAAALPLLLAATPAPAAAAATAPSAVLTHGSCSIHSTWKITMAYADGRIEAAFEVDQGKIGASWRVRLVHNGVAYYKATVKTLPPDGSFEVNKFVPNLQGVDTIRGSAINLATGETCKGSASL
jgi:hypothetical protein